MFTGIVEEVGTVVQSTGHSLTVGARLVLEETRLGDSIAIDGACLTVTHLDRSRFTVGLQPETLRRTTLGLLRPGSKVNLERALLASGRLGGHFVQGHIDGTGQIQSIRPEGEARLVRFSASERVLRYVVEKGFIAVDGVSLTIVSVDEEGFGVSLVDYTQSHVTLLDKQPGAPVNLEVDILSKYVERFLGHSALGSKSDPRVASEETAIARPGGLTLDYLREHGF